MTKQMELIKDVRKPWWVDNPKLEAMMDRHDAKMRAEREAFLAREPITCVLVACAARKLDRRAEARELYTSTLFKAARAYAEKFGEEWYILSALHGVLRPTEMIRPYNRKLSDFNKREREAWAGRAVATIADSVPRYSHIIILAGKDYREHIEGALIMKRFTVDVPLRGLGLGQQVQRLHAAVK